jgi:drug/metabolite transporter (DMT)-like permease
MKTATLALILGSVALSALAQVSFKTGVSSGPLQAAFNEGDWRGTAWAMLLSPNILAGLCLYGLGTILWLGVLARVELSQAYPFVGLGFVLTAVLGYFLFGEAITMLRVAGTVLVVAGIYLVACG